MVLRIEYQRQIMLLRTPAVLCVYGNASQTQAGTVIVFIVGLTVWETASRSEQQARLTSVQPASHCRNHLEHASNRPVHPSNQHNTV